MRWQWLLQARPKLADSGRVSCLASRFPGVASWCSELSVRQAKLMTHGRNADGRAVEVMEYEEDSGRLGAGAGGWNRLDWLAIADGRAYRIECGLTLEAGAPGPVPKPKPK